MMGTDTSIRHHRQTTQQPATTMEDPEFNRKNEERDDREWDYTTYPTISVPHHN